MIPIVKYEQHINFFCKNTMAECPHCFEEYPNELISEHIKVCTLNEKKESSSEYYDEEDNEEEKE